MTHTRIESLEQEVKNLKRKLEVARKGKSCIRGGNWLVIDAWHQSNRAHEEGYIFREGNGTVYIAFAVTFIRD